MAKENHISIPAHYNIYTGENNNRKLSIYFSEPEKGLNKDTGLLLLIPGFGGNSQSKIYKKMRLELADRHNLVVIQCDYFGSEYMQKSKNINLALNHDYLKKILTAKDYLRLKQNMKSLDGILEVLSKYSSVLSVKENLEESVSNFNDMGFMQALDLLTAIYAVRLIIEDNQLEYDKNKLIAYGHSHGAYLSYLCNRLAQHEFSLIIDNSAWVEPLYLSSTRYLTQPVGNMVLKIQFDYLAKKLEYDKDILNLKKLYSEYNNTARIISFQGTEDNLVNYIEKEQFCNSLENTKFYLIDNEQVDRIKFFSAGHGLNADFIKMFDFVQENLSLEKGFYKRYETNKKTIISDDHSNYVVDFNSGLPLMTINKF